MDQIKFLLVGGYFYSGSSAVFDLLKEYEDVYAVDSEIRFFTDPYGIIELERKLIDDWNWIRAAMAIEDFYDYSVKCARKKSYFPMARFGMGYTDNLNSDYLKITKEFIDALTEFVFDGDFYAFKAKDRYWRYVINRCRMGLEIYSKGKIRAHRKRMLRFSHPNRKEFYDKVKQYNERLFFPYSNICQYVMLDQAIAPRDLSKVNKYFNNGKMIVVDRDPRDIFIDTNRNGAVVYENTIEAGMNFVKLQKTTRENVAENENILCVRFEDLILDYKVSVKRIETFLGLDSDLHKHIGMHLKPEISKKNIGMWKKESNSYDQVFAVIEEQMREYLYP